MGPRPIPQRPRRACPAAGGGSGSDPEGVLTRRELALSSHAPFHHCITEELEGQPEEGEQMNKRPYRVLLGFHGDSASPEHGMEVHELGYEGADDCPLPLLVEPAEFEPLVMFTFPNEEEVRYWARRAFRAYRIIDVFPMKQE